MRILGFSVAFVFTPSDATAIERRKFKPRTPACVGSLVVAVEL